MELKYPKISSGLKMIYASWWVEFLGGLLGAALTFMAFVTGMGGLLGSLGSLITLAIDVVFYVLLIGGLYKASKEEKKYKKVLFLFIATFAFSMLMLVPIVETNLVWTMVLTILVMLLESVRICWFVKITEELVDKEGDAGVAGYYKVMVGCYIGVGTATICETLAAVVPALDVIEGLMAIVMMICGVVAGILYILFLHNTNKFFKTLEKPKSADPWEEFSSFSQE